MESTVASLQACPHCGALNRPRLHFCLSCGGRLAAADAPAAPEGDKPRSVLEKIEAAKKEVESALGPLTVNPPVTVSPGTYESQRYSPVPPDAPRRSRPGLWTGIALVVVVALIASWLYAQYGAQGRHVSAAPVVSEAPSTQAETPAAASPAADTAAASTPSASAAPSGAADAPPPASTEASASGVVMPAVPPMPAAEPPKHEAQRKAAKPKTRATKTDAPAVAAPSPAPDPPAPAPAPAPPVKAEPAAPTLAQKVAQCRALGFFEKERCLWAVCGNHWGKDGCPAYQQTKREPGG